MVIIAPVVVAAPPQLRLPSILVAVVVAVEPAVVKMVEKVL
jgi:hypothetical protein